MFFNNFITMPNRACAEINYKPLQIEEAICQTAKWHASEPFVDPWHYTSREKELQIESKNKHKKISGSLLRDLINQRPFEKNYIVENSVYQYLQKMLEDSVNLFE